jgi:hypothetical protein
MHSKMAMRSPNNMVEVGEIEQSHPTRLKQGGKSGTIENIWTMRDRFESQARDGDRRTSEYEYAERIRIVGDLHYHG